MPSIRLVLNVGMMSSNYLAHYSLKQALEI